MAENMYFDVSKSMGKRFNSNDEKGTGWLGLMKRPDGNVSTEISVGTSIDGKQTEIPLMVPTLDAKEIKYLLETPVDSKKFMDNMPKTIMQKAVEHANTRVKGGKSPFKMSDEEWD